MILLDTNLVSEFTRARPDPSVQRWLNQRFSECAISSVSVLELLGGAAAMRDRARGEAIASTIGRVLRRFGSRVYAFDLACAQEAARLVGVARAAGLGMHQLSGKLADIQLAGTASAYGLQFATRNIRDFQGLGLDLVDPWSAS